MGQGCGCPVSGVVARKDCGSVWEKREGDGGRMGVQAMQQEAADGLVGSARKKRELFTTEPWLQ